MKLQREYDALLGGTNGLITKYPDRFPAEHFTYENWVWAFTMLFSRAIRLRNLKQGEALALVPYADLINHSPFSQAYIDARESGDWIFKSGEEEVILYADRGYRRMEQILRPGSLFFSRRKLQICALPKRKPEWAGRKATKAGK